MKLNHIIKRAINRHAHAEAIRYELCLKKTLTKQALKYQEEGRKSEEIRLLMGMVESNDID